MRGITYLIDAAEYFEPYFVELHIVVKADLKGWQGLTFL